MFDADFVKLVMVLAPLIAGWREQRKTRVAVEKLDADFKEYQEFQNSRLAQLEVRLAVLEERHGTKG